MNGRLRLILENAMKEEEYFHQFYQDLADKASDEDMKEELMILSEQEALHKEKLASLMGLSVDASKIDALDIADELALPPIEEFLDMESMFEFAIKQEVAAWTLYFKLAESVDDPSAKKLLMKLVDEEKKHQQILSKKLILLRGGQSD